MSDTYPSLDAYNADVEAARNAYAADQAVERGFCGTCQERVLSRGKGRLCWVCAAAEVGAA